MLTVNNGKLAAPGCSREDNILCGAARARARSALHDALPTVLTASDDVGTRYATHLEACAAAYSMHDYGLYLSMMSRIVYNLKTNGEHIVTSYPVSQVCRLSHKRLRAETVHAQRDAAVELRLQTLMDRVKREADRASETASSIQSDATLRCPKCKATNDITRVLAQLRRGDEGMTTRCLCRCGATWNMAS